MKPGMSPRGKGGDEVSESQMADIKRAMGSLDRGDGASHHEVKDWVTSWGSANEKPAPKRSGRRRRSLEAIVGLAALRASVEQDDQCAATPGRGSVTRIDQPAANPARFNTSLLRI